RVLIPASSLVTAPARLPAHLLCCDDAPLPRGTFPKDGPPVRGFGGKLSSPDHFRRRSTRLVSYYALFKGMAASKPTSQLSGRTHILSFSTQLALRDLSRRSGFLPSRVRRLARAHCLPGSLLWAF